MITKGVMVYYVQETWVVSNSMVMVRGHMIFYITGWREPREPEEGNLEE